MTNRVKEEERIEKIIRGLLKLPENRRCINCNSLGPQYVCTSFWTFVCTNCSGAHREFAHRVKSVSMAKFSSEEVDAIQAGGNEKARQIYLKSWDPQRHSFPDGSNLQRLSDFIKHVYVDRKYTGERSADKLPTVKVGAKEDLHERYNSGGWKDERNLKNYTDDRRSPHYKQENDAKENLHERCAIERYSPGRWKDDRNSKNSLDERRSPHYRPENGTKDEFHEWRSVERHSLGGRKDYRNVKPSPHYKPENARPGGRRSRPANFVIVDDRVRDDRKRSGKRPDIRSHSAEPTSRSKSPDSQNSREMTGSPVVRSVDDLLGEDVPPLQVGEHPEVNDKSDKDGSADDQKKIVEYQRVNSASLIDFEADPEPSETAAAAQTEQTPPLVDGGNLALVVSTAKENASDAPNVDSVEALLFGFSPPTGEPVGVISDAPGSGNAPSAVPVASSNIVRATSLPAIPSTPPGVDGSSTALQTNLSVGALYNQPWIASQAPSSEQAQDTSSGFGPLAIQTVEANSDGRKELPADLFSGGYSSFHAPVPSWQIRPPHGMGYGMQYHPTAMPVSAIPNSGKSRNPFDISDDTPQGQSPMFPSMSPLQGALPMTSPYAPALPSQSPSHGMPPIPNAFMGQHLPNNMPPIRPQGSGSFDGSHAAFASLNPIQRPVGTYQTSTTPNSFPPTGGNPFG